MASDRENDKDVSKTETAGSMVLLGMYNLGYNVSHTLKMVIVKNVEFASFSSGCLEDWLKISREYTISKAEKKCEIVMHFKTINEGNTAYIDLKEQLDDGEVEVTHPNFEYWGAHPCIYWGMLSNITAVEHPPMPLLEFESSNHRGDRFRHCAVENVPLNLTDDDLLDKFEEARDIIVFNHDTSTAGVVLLEFETEEKAREYSKKRECVEIEGCQCPVSFYPERVDKWQESGVTDQVQERRKNLKQLSNDERLELLKEHKSLHGEKKRVLDDEMLSGQEKMAKFFELHQKQAPIKWAVHHDTECRRAKNIPLPEPEELKFIKNYPPMTCKEAKKRRKAAKEDGVKDVLHTKKFYSVTGTKPSTDSRPHTSPIKKTKLPDRSFHTFAARGRSMRQPPSLLDPSFGTKERRPFNDGSASFKVPFRGNRSEMDYSSNRGKMNVARFSNRMGYSDNGDGMNFNFRRGMAFQGSRDAVDFDEDQDMTFSGNKSRATLGRTGDSLGFKGARDEMGFRNTRNEMGFSSARNEMGFSGARDEMGFRNTRNEMGFSGARDEMGFSSARNEMGFSSARDEMGFSGARNEMGGARAAMSFSGSGNEMGFSSARNKMGFGDTRDFSGARDEMGWSGTRRQMGGRMGGSGQMVGPTEDVLNAFRAGLL